MTGEGRHHRPPPSAPPAPAPEVNPPIVPHQRQPTHITPPTQPPIRPTSISVATNPVGIDPTSPRFSQVIALVDRTTADDGRTRRVVQLLVVLTVLGAVLLAVGGAVLGLVGTGVAGSLATLLLGGGSALGVQRVAGRSAARRASAAPPAQYDVPPVADPATNPFPVPGAGAGLP